MNVLHVCQEIDFYSRVKDCLSGKDVSLQKTGGTGLGLSIVKHIAEHNGRKGSAYKFR